MKGTPSTVNVLPHVLVNVAMSADGKIDTVARKGEAISSPSDKARVDQLRADSDAVLVGGRTLVIEDPKLTVKSAQLRARRKADGLDEHPIKIGIVSVADLQIKGNFLSTGSARKLIYTTKRTPKEQVVKLKAAGAQVFVLGDQVVDLRRVMKSIREQGIRKLMVEGGGTLIAELFRLGLVDELMIYIAPIVFGGDSAPTPADGPGFLPEQAPRLRLESVERFDDQGGVFLHYSVQRD